MISQFPLCRFSVGSPLQYHIPNGDCKDISLASMVIGGARIRYLTTSDHETRKRIGRHLSGKSSCIIFKVTSTTRRDFEENSGSSSVLIVFPFN